MLAGVKTRPDGGRVAPNLYTLVLPKDGVEALQKESLLLDDLAKGVEKAGQDAGLVFVSPVVVRVAPKAEAPAQFIQVTAQVSIASLAETTDFWVEPGAAAQPESARERLPDRGWHAHLPPHADHPQHRAPPRQPPVHRR